MGSGLSLSSTFDNDSVAEPGKKCMTTEEIKLDYDAFATEVYEALKNPVGPRKAYVLKSAEVKELGGESFVVKVILDGKKLDSWGMGKKDAPGTDAIDIWMKITLDRAGRKLVSETYAGTAWVGGPRDQDTKVEGKGVVHFLPDPLRVEYYYVDYTKAEAGEHKSDASIEAYVKPFLLEAMTNLVKSKVQVAFGDSIKEPGQQSVVTDAMDEHTNFEALFDSLVSGVRDRYSAFPGVQVEDVSATEFVVKNVMEKPDGTSVTTTTSVFYDQGTGEMRLQMEGEGGGKNLTYYVLHKEPLRLETWTADGETGARDTPKSHVKLTKAQVHAAIDKSNSWW